MKILRKLFLFLLLLVQANNLIAKGENYYFRNLNVNNGLSHNTVNAILQDKIGFMWFGTKDGLNRYDGYTMKIFRHEIDDKKSLGNNFVTALCQDSKKRLWIGTDAGVYIYYLDREYFEHFTLTGSTGAQIENTVTGISEDKDGNIWIAVERQGLFCFNIKTEKLFHNPLRSFTSNVMSLCFDNSGRIWIGFYGGGLFYSDNGAKTLKPYKSQADGTTPFSNDVIMKIIKGPYNCIYLSSTKSGVAEISLTTGKLRTVLRNDETGENVFCRDLLFSNDNELLIGTESGVYVYNMRTEEYSHIRNSSNDHFSLSDNAVYSLYKDNAEGIWIGSYFGGVDYYPKSYTYFEKHYQIAGRNSLNGKHVREFCIDGHGKIWIGTEDSGLNCYDPQTKNFTYITQSAEFKNIHGLCMIGDKLWVGTFSKGLKIIDTNSGKVIKSYQKGTGPHSLIDNGIFSICKTSAGDIFLGTMFGLLKYNSECDGFDQIKELSGKFIYSIKEDSQGNLWLATYANGLFCFNATKKKWINYLHNSANRNSLPYNKVIGIFEDSKRRMWFTTQGGGFCMLNSDSKTFTNYNTSNGIRSDVVYDIQEDDDGLLWMTTNQGLLSFNPGNKHINNYTTSNGLLSNQFNYRSGVKDNMGNIYFGSIDGFIVFNPKTFVINMSQSEPVITDFMLFSKRVSPNEEGSFLAKSIVITDDIDLEHNQNSFSFHFACLDYQATNTNKFMYKLEGFDKEWITSENNPVVSYSNLEYGNYVLHVKSVNGDGLWSTKERVLNIHIHPPFYLTIYAYIIYFLLVVSIVAYTYMSLKKVSIRHRKRQMEKFEQEKEREVYHAKIDFFTNVAHEIRTPLSLIKGPLENILLKSGLSNEVRKDLGIMQRNTERLLNLTNQLLDFRKIETDGYRLNFSKCNIPDIINETFTRFSSLAAQRNLDFKVENVDNEFFAHVNQEAFTKILSNLLNNGIKYSSSYLYVKLVIDGDIFHVITQNDGSVIPLDKREQIFKPFFRYNEHENVALGTGIGLAMARSLAELHNGSLKMTDNADANEFILTLPVVQNLAISLEAEIDENKEEVKAKSASEQISKNTMLEKIDGTKQFTVLVVEDNEEMLSFVAQQLSDIYNVLTAVNGKEALDVLDNNYVNVVVSDVMMPVMDGFELCSTIKQNINYSHIPVILLTAKTNLQSKIEGMETGADSYIEKPFSTEYLLAVISNLISNREKIRKTFADSPFVAVNTMAVTKADEKFIKKLNEIMLVNISNPEFNMDDMAENLNMSRSSFYRKIKGVLDLTPNEYLRIERLKRAAVLLKEGENRVHEICYMVGFSSPSYFSKCFQKQFGVLPKEFVDKKE